jgi:hypothetical protein
MNAELLLETDLASIYVLRNRLAVAADHANLPNFTMIVSF